MTFTLEYADDAELKAKLSAILLSLEDWQGFDQVRDHYGFKSSALTMRLARFTARGGSFPKQMNGRGIKRLKVTPQLAEYLSNGR